MIGPALSTTYQQHLWQGLQSFLTKPETTVRSVKELTTRNYRETLQVIKERILFV